MQDYVISYKHYAGEEKKNEESEVRGHNASDSLRTFFNFSAPLFKIHPGGYVEFFNPKGINKEVFTDEEKGEASASDYKFYDEGSVTTPMSFSGDIYSDWSIKEVHYAVCPACAHREIKTL